MAKCEISAREAEKRRCKERIRRAVKAAASESSAAGRARETAEILREADSTQALIQRGTFLFEDVKTVIRCRYLLLSTVLGDCTDFNFTPLAEQILSLTQFAAS